MTAADREGRTVDPLVDEAPYQLRNLRGAVLAESVAVLAALAGDAPVEEVRAQALSGGLFNQRSWQTRRHCWHAVHARYLSHRVRWVIDELAEAAESGPHDPTTVGLLYLHFALRDRLTRDWITGPVWDRWAAGQWRLTRHDVLADLGVLLADDDVRWAESSRTRLATSLLSALRDFGLARGVQVKHLQRPVLTSRTVAHLLRILVERGVGGAALVEHPHWRLFFRSPEDVAGELARLAQDRVIRFERAGSTVVLETAWSGP